MRSQFLVGFTARGAWLAAMWVMMAAVSGCTYESSSLSGVLCEEEGKRDGARVCRDGVWVQEGGEDLPVSDLPDEGDLPVDLPDEGDLAPDMDMCVPESDQAFCLRSGAACGSKTAEDSCGQMRTVADCGVCPDSGVCQADNTCGACVPEDDATLCARLGKTCGLVSATDNCGQPRADVGCGACQGASDQCVDNQCVCQPETTEQYCGRLGAQCGLVRQGVDNCGQTRVDVMCGTCAQGTCEAGNTCSVCQAESDAAFCARTGASCGSKTAADNCNVMRTVADCGACANGQTCDATNQCICPAPVCPGGAECGSVSNACGRSTSCGPMNGACAAGEVCGNNQCDCPTPVCPMGAQCGSVSNACGNMTQCGPMNGMCAAGSACQGNACVCTPESNAAFCSRTGATCGSKTAADNCGQMRTVADCGMCMNGQTCTNNTCACAPETNAAFCARTGATCGSKTAADNCGQMRTVNDCGMCMNNQTCTNNACVCAPETDAAFCSRTGATCGSKTAADNCGQMRTVANCGMCMNNQTCTSNACVCAPESDAAFCTRLGAECGSKTAADNCGQMRTVADCGACAVINTCVNNTCPVCMPESDAAFCARTGAACGSKTAADNCGDMRTVNSCGVCMNGQVCGAAMNNTCGDVVITAQMPNPNQNDIFGLSVALKGDYLIVGKPDGDVSGATDKGAVHVYKRDVMTNRWSWSQTLSPNDHTDMAQRGDVGDYFGWAVAFDGTTLVVGAPEYNLLDDTHNGKGYVFTYTLNGMGQFVFQQKLAPNAGGVSDTSNDARFGWSVSVDGATMVVGAPRDDDNGGRNEAGSIYILGRSGNTWSQTDGRLRVISLRPGGDSSFSNAGGDEYGYSVAISGDTIVAGAPFRDTSGAVDGGIVVILQRSAGTWARASVFDPMERSQDARVGFSVALKGTRAVFGAPGGDGAVASAGVLYIMENPGAAGRTAAQYQHNMAVANDFSARAVAVDGNRVVTGATSRDANGHTDAGAAHLYVFSAGNWGQRQIVAPAASSSPTDFFGRAVAIDGNRVAISAVNRDSNGQTDSGAVFIFEY